MDPAPQGDLTLDQPPLPRRPLRAGTMPVVPEAIGPWLVAAVATSVTNLVLVLGGWGASLEQALLLVLLAAAVTGAGLIAARSNEAVSARDREERARPAGDELRRPGAPVPAGAYLAGIRRWAAEVQELLEHAIGTLRPDDLRRLELGSAAEDTAELLDLLQATEGDLSLNERATLRAVCTLWEAGQEHAESLAASVDPGWYRRWQARAVVARRLRHGQVDDATLELPYRS